MKNIPFLLIYSRIVVAILIGVVTFLKIEEKEFIIITLLTIGFLTDVFDGVIARKLGVSSKKLRIWDSNVDQFFWLVTIASIFYINFLFIKDHYLGIILVLFLEVMAYVVSYIKFKKTIATHSLLAKLWTITLLLFLVDLTINSNSNVTFWICLILGIISRIEIIAIIMQLNKWATDIPSIFAVNKLNRGMTPKKYKLFNS